MKNNFSTSMSLTEFSKSYTLQWNKIRLADESYLQIMAEVWHTLSTNFRTDPMAVFARLTSMKERLGCSVIDIKLVSNATGASSRLTEFCLDQGLYVSFNLLHWAELLAMENLDPALQQIAALGITQTYLTLNNDSTTQNYANQTEVDLVKHMSPNPANLLRARQLDLASFSGFEKALYLFALDENQRRLEAAAEAEKARLERLTRKPTCHSNSKKSAPKLL